LPGHRRPLAQARQLPSHDPERRLMFAALASALANVSLALKQPLTAYCDIETSHDDALITKSGAYCSWLRVDGMQRMAERKDFKAEYAANAKQIGRVGRSQRIYLGSEVMAARHTAFVSRVRSALHAHDVSVALLSPHDALRVSREAMYREMAGSEWRPSLP